ncbi:unnamed protein product [Pylaiella littoralis]
MATYAPSSGEEFSGPGRYTRSRTATAVSVAATASKRRRRDSDESPPTNVNKQEGGKPVAPNSSSRAEAKSTTDAVISSVVMVQPPGGFSFSQAACSYGYYIVPPNLWQPCKDATACKDSGTFSRPLRFGQRLQNTAKCTISQVPCRDDVPASTPNGSERGAEGGEPDGSVALRVDVASTKTLTESDQEDIRSQVRASILIRMFQTTFDLKPWFHLSPEAEKRGYGRLFRSPTVFEDMVKSITGCNMKFQGTIRMNKLLCEHFGRDQAFPTPEDLKGVQAEDLKEKAKVGYRADRILRLAQNFRDGTVDPDWLEAPERTREEVLKFVKNLYGFGDYAAGNVAMLLGFYEEVPMDSETVRHFKDYHGVTTKSVKEVAPRVKKEYQPYAPYQFLQYWYEMIVWHEKKRDLDIHLWDVSDFSY